MKRILVCLLVLFTVSFTACSQSQSNSSGPGKVDIPYSGPIIMESQEYRGESFDPAFGHSFYMEIFSTDRAGTLDEQGYNFSDSAFSTELFITMGRDKSSAPSFSVRGSSNFIEAINAYASFPGVTELLAEYYSTRNLRTWYSTHFDSFAKSRDVNEYAFDAFIEYANSHASSFKFGRDQVWTYKFKFNIPKIINSDYQFLLTDCTVYLTVLWRSEEGGMDPYYHVIRDYGTFASFFEE
jgi:hypothetical protein